MLIALAFLVEIGAWYGKLRFDLRKNHASSSNGKSLASSLIPSYGIYVRPTSRV